VNSENLKRGPFITTVSQYFSVLKALIKLCVWGTSLSSLVLLHRPKVAFEYLKIQLFNWQSIKGMGLPIRHINEIFEIPPRLQLDLLPTTGGYFSMENAAYVKDIIYLTILCKVLSPRVIFEIGTLQGHTASIFALNSAPETTIYTLNLPPQGKVSSLPVTLVDSWHIEDRSTVSFQYIDFEEGKKVQQLYGDSAVFDFSPYQNQVNLFFIDGAHSYDYVKSDTLKALSCMAPESIIIWHDYGRWGVNGVSKWLHEYTKIEGKEVFRLHGSSLAIMKV